MRRFFTAIVVAMLWLAAGTSPGTALENLRVFRGVLILEGKIESGDYLSVRNFLRDKSNFEKISGGVFLASPGGSVLEALKIGRLIRELRLSTEAPASPPPDRRDISAPLIRGRDLSNSRRYDCVSACFFLYVAGIYRTLNWAGRLGIHQPRMEQIREGLTEGDIANASARVRNAIKDYMESMHQLREPSWNANSWCCVVVRYGACRWCRLRPLAQAQTDRQSRLTLCLWPQNLRA